MSEFEKRTSFPTRIPVGLFKAFLDLERAVKYHLYGDVINEVKTVWDLKEGSD